MTGKKIIIIAGPNGAGKTTFARSFLPQDAQCPRFINADLIAAGLSPFQPEAAGYHISLFFLALPNAETAIARVAERVRQGGHAIPEAVIRRRFVAGLNNFDRHYKHRVHTWAKYDNTEEQPVLLGWGEHS